MKKRYKFFAAMLALTLSMSTTAFAGTWKQEADGWWWQNDDGSYPQSGWQWIDGNNDGVAESYYFNENGYLLTNTTTPDGYTVNEDGAWTVNGVVQQKEMRPGTDGGGTALDGAQLYLEASKKNSQLSSMAATNIVNANMTIDGQTVPVSMTMDMKFKDLNQGSMKYLVNTRTTMTGLSMDSTMFYTDGYYYIDMMGQKQKVAMDLDSMTQTIENASETGGMAGYMQNVSVSDDGNGNKIVSYTSDISGMGDYLQNMYDQMGMAVNSISLKSMNAAAVINPEGYIVSENINMSFSLAALDKVVDADMDMQMNYTNIGQPVYFTLPSTEGYVEAGAVQ